MDPRSSEEPDEPHALDLLAEYFSGSLAPAEESVVEAHLLACAACRAEYDELGQLALTLAWLSALDDPDAPQ